jgi:hypothetical protein
MKQVVRVLCQEMAEDLCEEDSQAAAASAAALLLSAKQVMRFVASRCCAAGWCCWECSWTVHGGMLDSAGLARAVLSLSSLRSTHPSCSFPQTCIRKFVSANVGSAFGAWKVRKLGGGF